MGSNSTSFDVVIVGGGIMGCCTACHLRMLDRSISIAIVERDSTYSRASTALSMANVRTQFSLRENILISQYMMEVLERFAEEMAVDGEAPDVAFHREGNLFLVDEPGVPAARAAIELQKKLGCTVDWWTPEEIEARFPLYRAGEHAGGTFGPDDGYIDAYSLLTAFRRKAGSLGAHFITGEAVEVSTDGKRASGVRLATGEELSAGVVVDCAGPWAADLALSAGVRIPVVPVKRQVFSLDPAVKPGGPLPLTILPSGLYFRTETGNLILCGKSLPDDPVGYDFNWDRCRFEEILWPELATFVPAFDRVKLLSGWAGLYAVNMADGNAILGEWPELGGFYLACGFSGHGLQQGPAVGRYISELILGKQPEFDLSIFSPKRILEGRRVHESGLV